MSQISNFISQGVERGHDKTKLFKFLFHNNQNWDTKNCMQSILNELKWQIHDEVQNTYKCAEF